MQKPRDEILDLYNRMGLVKTSEFTEPEDHITLELQFMAHLCNKTREALMHGNCVEAKKYLEVQRDFLNAHLGIWVQLLVADILKGGKIEFYKAVGKITRAYVEMDTEIVLELLDRLASSKVSSEYMAKG